MHENVLAEGRSPKARTMPVPSDHGALRRIEARRRAAFRAAHPEQARSQVGPWGAFHAEARESGVAKTLRRVDAVALTLMSAWVLAQWPFAVSLIIGWI
jgi:hypothetical protein